MKLLILEDNKDCITIYKDILGKNNVLTMVSTIRELEAVTQKKLPSSFDIFLADLMLPDGFFLDWITKSKSIIMEQIPTVIVSSMEDIDLLRKSFQWGATDYLIKPFRVPELIVKVERLQRDYFSKKTIDGSIQNVMDELTGIETKLFQLFMSRIDLFIDRGTITSEIWRKVQVNPKTLDVHLSNLRGKLARTSWEIISCEGSWKLTKTHSKS